jgi:hypothetical protein
MKDVHCLDVKSAEQNFLSEVEYDFELAPGVSRSILESVKYHFDPEYFHENELRKNKVPLTLFLPMNQQESHLLNVNL